MLSYPTEANKGKGECPCQPSFSPLLSSSLLFSSLTSTSRSRHHAAIAIFWIIFNMGGLLGSAVEIGLGWDSMSNTVSNQTYIAFVVITGAGAFCTLLLRNPKRMIRSDGSRVVLTRHLPWYKEMTGLARVLHRDPWILLLVPLSLASNYCYAWQQTVYNGYFFSLRSRGINSLLYWLAQMVGALIMGFLVDTPHISRRLRAWCGWALATTVCWASWGGAYEIILQMQKYYARHGMTLRQYAEDFSRIGLDIHCGYNPVPCHSNPWHGPNPYAGRAILYFCLGLMDACTQVFCYSLFGMLSNDISKLAYCTAMYKAVQSAGNVAGWAMENHRRPFATQLGVAWGLNVGGLLFVVPLLIWRVTDHTTWERELNNNRIVDAAAEPGPSEADADADADTDADAEAEGGGRPGSAWEREEYWW